MCTKMQKTFFSFKCVHWLNCLFSVFLSSVALGVKAWKVNRYFSSIYHGPAPAKSKAESNIKLSSARPYAKKRFT